MDDDHDDRSRSCPKCDALCKVSSPAEPDVGIMGDAWYCQEHGEFYEDGGTGKLVFVDEGDKGEG